MKVKIGNSSTAFDVDFDSDSKKVLCVIKSTKSLEIVPDTMTEKEEKEWEIFKDTADIIAIENEIRTGQGSINKSA